MKENCTRERLTRAARSAAPRRYALLSLQTRLLAVFYALGTAGIDLQVLTADPHCADIAATHNTTAVQ